MSCGSHDLAVADDMAFRVSHDQGTWSGDQGTWSGGQCTWSGGVYMQVVRVHGQVVWVHGQVVSVHGQVISVLIFNGPLHCSKILANKEFIDFVTANCIMWSVGVNTEEGVRVSYILRENTYPFLALIVLRQSRMVVVERVEGLLPLRELIARLAVAVRMNEAELVVERNER